MGSIRRHTLCVKDHSPGFGAISPDQGASGQGIACQPERPLAVLPVLSDITVSIRPALLVGESTVLRRYPSGPLRAETLLLACRWKGFLVGVVHKIFT